MRSLHFMGTLVLVSVLAFGSACESETSGGGSASGTKLEPSLAKAKITDATGAAKEWKPDAFLIQIAKGGVGADGKHILWDYGFYSPSAKGCLVVNVAPQGTSKTESGDEMCASGEIKEFMDSDKAIEIARSNGITAADVTMVVSTSHSAAAEDAVWSVMDERGMKPGNVMLEIDAVTGKVLSKTNQQ